ncbi:uncharacterized protein DSM5745_02712 [Aspergillus mulundensis]|uniref:ribonuclease H n=1 Tax=Aspergillus mulundensis TaxID=1810919 RepID=A0A3D8SIB7_9EURO|nr:hypothetical protein DSM5745_02712 [Aspergillus mulundensis]RDW86070.1 hypothetical protein DSM5745_02712 [Aspergillus mulundensis]
MPHCELKVMEKFNGDYSHADHTSTAHEAYTPSRELTTLLSLMALTNQPTTATDIPPRRFLLQEHYPPPFHTNPLDIESAREGWVFLACPGSPEKCPHCKRHPAHTSCIVIAIDGACQNNGSTQGTARAAFAAYFGKGNELNTARLVGADQRQTSQVAELAGAIEALRIVAGLPEEQKPDGKLYTVTLKSDSAYVVQGVTEYLAKWKRNGWRNAQGKAVANIKLWKELEGLVERVEENGVGVWFWLVPRELNPVADAAAKWALRPGNSLP